VEGMTTDVKPDDTAAPAKKISSFDLSAIKVSASSHEFNEFSELKEDDDLETILNSTYENGSTQETHDRQAEMVLFHRTVKSIFEEEEALLNLHMSVIQVRIFFLFDFQTHFCMPTQLVGFTTTFVALISGKCRAFN
jgi:hypothetical protein